MQLRVVTDINGLGGEMRDHLQEEGHEVELKSRAVRVPELIVREGLSSDDTLALLRSANPFRLKITVSAELDEGVDAEICLGEGRSLDSWDLHLYSESESFSKRISNPLVSMGFCDGGHGEESVTENVLKYGGASDFARSVVRWHCARLGIESVRDDKVWGDGDNDIYLKLIDPVAQDPKHLAELTVTGDDLDLLFTLRDHLNAQGYAKVAVIHDAELRSGKFLFKTGPFKHDDSAREELENLVSAFLGELDVDPESHPLKAESSPGDATIEIPILAYRAGEIARYAGDHPSRWKVYINTDSSEEVEPLAESFRGMGYTVEIDDDPEDLYSLQLNYGEIGEFEETVDTVRQTIETFVGTLGLDPQDANLTVDDSAGGDAIHIDLPIESLRNSTVDDRMKTLAEDWECRLKTPDVSNGYDNLHQELEDWPFMSYDRVEESASSPEIKYGGEPRALIHFLCELVEQRTGVRPTPNKVWGDDDDDIWIYLPRPGAGITMEEDEGIDTSVWFTADGVQEYGDLIEIQADAVRIGHVTLPRGRPGDRRLVPPAAMFEHYCLDQRTAESLLHVAEGVALREPVLLEGETSVSKTSIIQMLAMLLDQPLVRLNLNGQTDTGELVGRFLPQNLIGDLPLDVQELMEADTLLESESRMILQKAHEDERALSAIEVQQIMANEGMHSHPWRWADGLVVSAMKHGWWVVLDELNLAEPQILERMNSVLERTPTLVLTEHDNTVFGADGEPVHPNFRVFGTMNPAEYSGRSVLSPAYRDRWRGYRFVPAPGEDDYHTMLRFLVSGQQPDVILRGRKYKGRRQSPAFGSLAEVAGIDSFLEALARFHSALESTARNPEKQRQANLGSRRRERYIFTRRGLLAVMDLITNAVATGIDSTEAMRVALLRYYLGRIANQSDQHTVARLMDAAGIGLNTWTVGVES